jgi:hypothetical protein
MRLGGSLALPISAGFEFSHLQGRCERIEGAPGTCPPSNEGGHQGGHWKSAPNLDSTVDTPLKSPLGKGGTIREQRASARTHNFFTASGDYHEPTLLILLLALDGKFAHFIHQLFNLFFVFLIKEDRRPTHSSVWNNPSLHQQSFFNPDG